MGCGGSKNTGAAAPPPPPAPPVKETVVPAQAGSANFDPSAASAAFATASAAAKGKATDPAPSTPAVSAPASASESTGVDENDDDDDVPSSVRLDATPQNTNVEATSEVVEDWPLMRYGQLTKQSGSGLVKNWRRRNFTCEKGVCKYYELFINEYPFGEREKGCFALTGYKVVEDANPREATQILLQSSENKSLDLLVQADDFKKKTTWVTIFKEHIAYADKYQVKTPERTSELAHKTSQRF